jgi:hypothetical protein
MVGLTYDEGGDVGTEVEGDVAEDVEHDQARPTSL